MLETHDPLKQRLLLQIGCVVERATVAQAGPLFTVQVGLVTPPLVPIQVHVASGPLIPSVTVCTDGLPAAHN